MPEPVSRLAAIQGLRAVAILLVVLYHAGLPLGGGFIGVDVFFVISGFVITRMVFRRSADSGRLSLKEFWAGRIRRLLPALAGVVLFTLALAVLLASPVTGQPVTAITGAASSLWVSNGVLAVLGAGYFSPATADNPLMHTWSLAVEEQFYVFFPLLVVALLWWTRRRGGDAVRRARIWIGLLAISSLLLCLALTYVRLPLPVGGLLAFYSPFTRMWEFAAGALLALAFLRGWAPGRWSRWSIPAGAVLLVASLVAVETGQRFPGWIAVLPVAASVLLLIGAHGNTTGVGLLSNRPMTYLGDISYSWYLYHWPLIVFATINSPDGEMSVPTAVAVLAAGLLLAAASYRWIEQPIRHRRRLTRVPAPALAALMIVPALIASYGLHAGAGKGWGNDDIALMQAQLDHDQWEYQEVCQSPYPVDEREIEPCRIVGDSDQRPLILVGDSNAGVYAELMVRVGAELHRTVTIATVPSCTLSELETISPDGSSWLSCADFYRSSMQWLAEQEPSTVVMASGLAAVDLDDFGLLAPDGTVKRTAEAKEATWRTALEKSYADIRAMGHDVVQVELVPHFLTWRASQCSLLEMLRDGVASCGTHEPRASSDDDQRHGLAAIEAATRTADVPQIRVRDSLCPDDVCRTNRGDTWTYEDGSHLSFDGALSLKENFLDVLG